jgi:Ni/Co efflux regulator RcnB
LKEVISMKRLLFSVVAALAASSALAQASAPATKPAAAPSEHVKKDITRHRAMAQAHEAAARCLEAGKSEDSCVKELQASCKGLAIGKYCGMRHEH